MGESELELTKQPSEPAANGVERSPEELAAKGIAPVKREFLCPPPVRASNDQNDAVSEAKAKPAKDTSVVKEKKSKRQLKRERHQQQKSALNLCPKVAKTGDPNACPYADNCRFSHDLEAFKDLRADDLEGECPFMVAKELCPYGLACRFLGTHQADVSVNGDGKNSECNGLRKDVQRLLWKNKMSFPKANAKLKALGLLGPANSKANILAGISKNDDDQVSEQNGIASNGNGSCKLAGDKDAEVENSSEVVENHVDDEPLESNEPQPPKKPKCEEDGGESNIDEVLSEGSKQPEAETIDDVVMLESDASLKLHPSERKMIDLQDTGDKDAEVENSSEVVENHVVDEPLESDETRPPKKPKCEEDGGASNIDEVVSESSKQPEAETVDDVVMPESDASLKLHPSEKKIIDFRDKLYLAPLTTVGNLPFRRLCKVLGADVTCGEMAMCTNLMQGQASEWALLRRHASEDLFGVQICGAYADTVARVVELIEQECTVDFIDINMGCPIELVTSKGSGSALLTKPTRMKGIVEAASGTVDTPVTIKVRTAYYEGKNRIDSLIADMGSWGTTAVTIHGRSRQQRYSKLADWEYVYKCAKKAPDTLQVLGNGDISSYSDWNKHKSNCPELSSCMIARGALVKPWVFTEIKEQRDWDISSGERLNILKDFVRFGLEHWGSDTKGVETTRHFLLEWLSYMCRYIPVGLLEIVPQHLNWRPPSFFGRDDLETLMASDSAADWIRISEILLGKVPESFTFAPKHKSNAYDRAENG